VTPAIWLENVTLRYRIPRERIVSLKEYAIRRIQKRVVYDDFEALHEINLVIEAGQRVGGLGAAPVRRAAFPHFFQRYFLHRLGQPPGGEQHVVHLADEGVDGRPVKLAQPLGHRLESLGVLGHHRRHQPLCALEDFPEARELVEDVEQGFSVHSGVHPVGFRAVQSCSRGQTTGLR